MQKLEAVVDATLPKNVVTNVNTSTSKDFSTKLDAKLMNPKLKTNLNISTSKTISSDVNANISQDFATTLNAKLVNNQNEGTFGKIFLNGYQIYPDIYGNINLNTVTQLNLKYGSQTTTELKVDEWGSISLGDIIIDCGGAFDG